MAITLKRVYDPPAAGDGARVLVDRLWPRGLTKAAAALDAWMRDVAPSNDLRQWYHAHPAQWEQFRKRYLKELSTETAREALRRLYDLALKKPGLTLLFASKSIELNHALVLKDLLEGKRKPPTGTGPAAETGNQRRAARRPK